MVRKTQQLERQISMTELNDQQRQTIINWTHSLLADMAVRVRTKITIETFMASVVGISVKGNAPLMRAAIMIFFETVMHDLSTKTYNSHDREKIAYELTSISGDFLKRLDPAEAVIATSRLIRIKELQRWLGHRMVSIAAVKIAQAPQSLGVKISKAMERVSISEQLDIVHQLATLSSNVTIQIIAQTLDDRSIDESIGSGAGATTIESCTVARNALLSSEKHMKILIQNIRNGLSLPIARYACDELMASVGAHHDTFLQSNISNDMYQPGTYWGNPTRGRQTERTDEEWYLEDSRLREQIIVPTYPPHLASEGKFLLHRIASDAVALYDHAMMPQDIARVDFSQNRPTTGSFQAMIDIRSDPELNPFRGSEQEYIPLLLQHLHRPQMRKVIESDLGISLIEIPIASQIHLLRFLATADKDLFKRFSRCLKMSGESRTDFLQSFMAAAESPATVQTIFSIVEKLHDNPKKLKKIFAILRTITDAASNTGNYMRSQYTEKEDQETVRKTIQRLLRKAKDILDASMQGTEGDIVESLSTVSSEVLLLTSTFKTLRESGVRVPLSEIKSIDPSILQGDDLKAFASNDKNWQTMESIYRSRYSDPKYRKKFKQKLIDSFHGALEKGDTTLYVVKHEGEIIAFCRFDEQENGNLYFGSFVVDERYENHKLGIALLEESLLKLGETRRIEADCDPDSPAAKLYAKLGFHVTKKYTLEGVPSTHIVREPDILTFHT